MTVVAVRDDPELLVIDGHLAQLTRHLDLHRGVKYHNLAKR